MTCAPNVAAVTGGTGFLGRAVVARLCAAGWRVRMLARNPPEDSTQDPVTVVRGSLEDEGALTKLVAGAQLVVHVAGLTRARSARDFHAVNVEGAKRLGRAIRGAAPETRIVAVSSLAAREPLLSPYAASKAAGEAVLMDHAASDSWMVLRPSALYGPGDPATLPIFRAAKLPLVPIPRQPAARMALLHVDDAARAVVAAAVAPFSRGVWELGDGCYGWDAIARAAGKALGRESVALLPVPDSVLAAVMALARLLAGGSSPMASPGKLAELLHGDWTCLPERLPPMELWSPTIGLNDGFAATVSWYRRHGWL